jgi:Beta-lactamase enzyme family
MRLPVIGLSLLVAIGVLVVVVESQSGGGRSNAAASGSSPSAAASHTAVTSMTAAPSARVTRAAVAASASAGVAAPKPRGNPLGAAASYLGTRSGTVLAAVYDLGTRQSWTIGGAGQAQDEASVVKVDVLETLLAQHPGGLQASDQALAQRMIEDSDNDAATELWDAVGGAGGIRAFNTHAGLTGTAPSTCVACPGFPWPGWGLSTTTPLDQIALLRELVSPAGSLLSAAERDYTLRLMENVTADQRWGVCGGVPAQVTVALKNGWLPLNAAQTDWQINSVGWVSGLGRDYLIAVLSTRNPSEAYGIETISELSALVWQQMG